MSSLQRRSMEWGQSGPGDTSAPSWQRLRGAVRETKRATSSTCSIRCPSHFAFRRFSDVHKTRIYFLCSYLGRESTLLYVDIDDSAPTTPVDSQLGWSLLISSTFQIVPSSGKLSKEEELLSERKRCVSWGITSFDLNIDTGKFLFPAAGSLFCCHDNGSNATGPLFPSELRTQYTGPRMNAEIAPSNVDLIAYVSNRDIWVTHAITGQEVKLTHCRKPSETLQDDPLTAGLPSYIMQEEFHRYSGFWWRPVTTLTPDGPEYTILYEEVDESSVEIIRLTDMSGDEYEEFRFPRAGRANAKSRLKLIKFVLDSNDYIRDVRIFDLKDTLDLLFPATEYLVRMGWTPDGSYAWCQLLDRPQSVRDLVFIPFDSFSQVSNDSQFKNLSNGSSIQVSPPQTSRLSPCIGIWRETSSSWIATDDILTFLPSDNNGSVTFIWASEESGFRHLYLIEVHISPSGDLLDASSESDYLSRAKLIRQVPLTRGEWTVKDNGIWIDQNKGLVFFHALKDTPLEKHFYVVSIHQPGHVRRLTQLGFSHDVEMDESCSMFVTSYSSIRTLPASQAFRVNHSDSTVDGISLVPAGWIVEPREDSSYQCPELFEHTIESGDKLYGMLFKPPFIDPTKKYPVILSVYAGPEVQLVSNSFKGLRQMRNHLLAAQGYCVVCIDSRGSHNRGKEFEAHIRGRMGQVEMADQVEVLEWLCRETSYMDSERIALYGWSYGGYMALMGLLQYPKVFKVSIAGAPVTSWYEYDTAYTERYMSLPSLNPEGYEGGSVINNVKQLPDEPNRLLLVHGLMDENVLFNNHTAKLIAKLVQCGKPYQLQIYPGERHSLRHFEAVEHYETTLLTFLKSNL